MQIGICKSHHSQANPPSLLGIHDIAAFHRGVQDFEKQGFGTVWTSSLFGVDHFAALAFVAKSTRKIQLGTSVVPVYSRHPIAMAQGARTLQWASDGRFRLGIGLAHKPAIEKNFGLPFEQPARFMHEYIQVLLPLLQGKEVSFHGKYFNVESGPLLPEAPAVPLYLAALGPKMLQLCGEYAEGTITWMAGPKTIDSYMKPLLRRSATEMGRPEPVIIAAIPIAITTKKDLAYEKASMLLSVFNNLPSYRSLLDREGYYGPEDAAVIGDEEEVVRQLNRLSDCGMDELLAVPFEAEQGGVDRTIAFLASRLNH